MRSVSLRAASVWSLGIARRCLTPALGAGLMLWPLLGSLHAATPTPRGVDLRWKKDPQLAGGMYVEASRLPAWLLAQLKDTPRIPPPWESFFKVTAKTELNGSPVETPAMSGRYTVTGTVVRFEPAFPLTPGVLYEAALDPAPLSIPPGAVPPRALATYRIPAAKAGPGTRVTGIYPTASSLPENLLKFYLHFSGPMSRGHIYDHIRLVDRSGKAVELPFLEIDEELWDPTMTRLTLFLDPGRIKRGVRPLEEVGPSLEAGNRYTLIIGREWQDSSGHRLRGDFRKSFTVTAADREPPDPSRWTLTPPKAGSRGPLRLSFPEPLDHALLERRFKVLDAQGHELQGRVTVDSHEQRWGFIPSRAWNAGAHQVVFPKTLEDLAGNNVGKPFDVDLFERVDRSLSPELVTLPFTAN